MPLACPSGHPLLALSLSHARISICTRPAARPPSPALEASGPVISLRHNRLPPLPSSNKYGSGGVVGYHVSLTA
ncbi:hypothetical protein LX32DRAFT_639182 [Colletotrichum zoysiae]|uniref:Uncharacterized protein n=1 Tax=Colletotrichum zoysiae TaxID=1216348 RepID=A0AAD9HHQ0_9PEZI|nr:hypothetical protein LX32DRAFT_639182 [Colletotrichum zoysiae]